MCRNETIAERLREAADLLEEQQANPFRVRAPTGEPLRRSPICPPE
jgi:hypothetical protein